jgi:uncharacterized protein YcaQ
VNKGILQEVEVSGWGSAYLHHEAKQPRKIHSRALLTPFDPLVFERTRLETLFGMRYRVEMYSKPENRNFGYYVMPFLLDETLAARVDLKSDRKTGTLIIKAANFEPEVNPAQVSAELAAELSTFASWQGLTSIAISNDARGTAINNLSASL